MLNPSNVDELFGDSPFVAPADTSPQVSPDAGAQDRLPARPSARKSEKKQAGPSTARSGTAENPTVSVQARYRRFITAYLKDPTNQSAAYRKAYPRCSQQASYTAAGNLLRHPWVQAELARRTKRVEYRAEVSIAELVGDLAKIKAFDVRKLYAPVLDADGEPRLVNGQPIMRRLEPWELDDATAAAVDGLKVKPGKFGDQIEYKAAGKINAIEILGRYKGMLKDPEKPPIIANIQINF